MLNNTEHMGQCGMENPRHERQAILDEAKHFKNKQTLTQYIGPELDYTYRPHLSWWENLQDPEELRGGKMEAPSPRTTVWILHDFCGLGVWVYPVNWESL